MHELIGSASFLKKEEQIKHFPPTNLYCSEGAPPRYQQTEVVPGNGRASYCSQREAGDRPPGFLQVFPAIASYILRYVTVTWQAAYCPPKLWQSVKDYQNHHTAMLVLY